MNQSGHLRDLGFRSFTDHLSVVSSIVFLRNLIGKFVISSFRVVYLYTCITENMKLGAVPLFGIVDWNQMSTNFLAFSEARSVKDLPSVVVFGRPGAGKTTVATAAVDKFKGLAEANDVTCLGLDLDVCVPQWMKDNFAKGIYPTLEQRKEFAKDCCEYVVKELDTKWQSGSTNVASIVSFSFVNTDLRDVYRSSFPNASWVLIDTTEKEATKRINEREDHFYKGDMSNDNLEIDSCSDDDEKTESGEGKDVDNSEWNFAPVTFPHVALDGDNSVDVNSDKVLDVLLAEAGIR